MRTTDLCPQCKQPLPAQATTHNPRGAVIPCEVKGCREIASFIQNRRALCFVHAELPAVMRASQ